MDVLCSGGERGTLLCACLRARVNSSRPQAHRLARCQSCLPPRKQGRVALVLCVGVYVHLMKAVDAVALCYFTARPRVPCCSPCLRERTFSRFIKASGSLLLTLTHTSSSSVKRGRSSPPTTFRLVSREGNQTMPLESAATSTSSDLRVCKVEKSYLPPCTSSG